MKNAEQVTIATNAHIQCLNIFFKKKKRTHIDFVCVNFTLNIKYINLIKRSIVKIIFTH